MDPFDNPDPVDSLARTLYGEAKAYSEQDAYAIADVVMNRVNLPNWPSTVSRVCKQDYQFSCWNTGDPNRERIVSAARGDNAWFDKCYDIAKATVEGGPFGVTKRATHYCTPAVKAKTYWAKGKTPCDITAGHLFFNDIDTPPPSNATEALDQQRPLHKTRTVKGSQLAGAAGSIAAVTGVASELAPALPVLNWVRDNLPFALMAFGVIVLLGAGYAVYARWDDRQKGRN
jgi:hypothetical protein